MKRIRSIIVFLLAFVFFSYALSAPTFAEDKPGSDASVTGNGLYPQEKTDKQSKNLYNRYPTSNYTLTYFDNPEDLGGDDGKEDCSWYSVGCKAGNAAKDAASMAYKAFFLITDGIWWLYLVIAKWLIDVISWGFTMQVLDYMFNAYSSTLEGMQKTFWQPFMFLMWSVAVAWMVYYWISGKSTRLWSTLINSLIIIALSATIMSNLPNFLRSLSDISTETSVLILSGLTKDQPDNPTKQSASDAAVDVMKDSLFNFAIVIPYKMVQFGSVPLSQKTDGGKMKFWETVVSQDSDGDRRDKIKDFFKKEKDDKEKEKYAWFTQEKVGTRLSFTAITFFASLASLLCFVMYAFYVIMWQLIGLGRALLTSIYFLLSLWPEYGMKEAAQHMWSVIQAWWMRLWYTVILAVFINLESGLVNEMEKDNIGMLSLWLIIFALFLGLNQALKELRAKLNQIPMGNGWSLAGVTNEGEEMGNKVAGAALMAAGAATGAGALVAGGLAMQQGGMGNVFKSAGLGAVSKVGGVTSKVNRAVRRGAGKGALAVVKGSGKLAGKAVKGGANWVDDALLKGKVKEKSGAAVDKVKDLANKGIEKINNPLNKVGWKGISTVLNDRLTKDDKQLMKDAKETDGLDLRKRADRDQYVAMQKGKKAKKAANKKIQKLEEYFNDEKRLVKKLPKKLPPKNSAEYVQYAEQYGEDVLDVYTATRQQMRSAKQVNRKRPLKERVKPQNFVANSRFGADSDTNFTEAFHNNLASKAKRSGYKPLVQDMNFGKQGKALPAFALAAVDSAIKGANLNIDINSKEITDAIRQQITSQVQSMMSGTGRGSKQNPKKNFALNLPSNNGVQTVQLGFEGLQNSYVQHNPIAASRMQATQAIDFGQAVTGSNNLSDIQRVLSTFKNELSSMLAHQNSGGKLKDFKGIERLERVYAELRNFGSTQDKIDHIGEMVSGSKMPLDQLVKLLDDNSRSLRPPTPK